MSTGSSIGDLLFALPEAPNLEKPPVLSLLERQKEEPAEHGPAFLRNFLEALVAASASAEGLVVGEAEPGRYVLVMPPLPEGELREQIEAGLDVILERLGTRWPNPHVSDFGLRELYEQSPDRWLARQGLEDLVRGGQIGVVTIVCHEWLYSVCEQLAGQHQLTVETSFDEYLRTGKFRVAGANSFQVDVVAIVREMAAGFHAIDHLVAKLLVLASVSGDETLAARLRGDP